MNSFLPSTYDRIPTNSDYMKFVEGDNNIRVLSSAVVGFEYWNTQNKPIRSKEGWDGIPADCKQENDGKYKISHFWAFVVWNYDEKRVQILEVTQKQIMKQLKAYVDNPRWGDPKNYDITISKSGTGFDTEYIVQPNPPIAPADPKILESYAQRTVNLEGLFDGSDPFGKPQASNVTASPTPGQVVQAAAARVQENAPLPDEPLSTGRPAPDFLQP